MAGNIVTENIVAFLRYVPREGTEDSITWYKNNIKWDAGHSLSIHETSNHASTVTYFLQPDYTYSHKAKPPDSAALFVGYFLSNHHNMYINIKISTCGRIEMHTKHLKI